MPCKTPIKIKSNQNCLFKLANASTALPAGLFLEEGPGEEVVLTGTPQTIATTTGIKIECESMETGEKSSTVEVEIKVKSAEFQAGAVFTFGPIEYVAQGPTGTLIKDTGIKHSGGVRTTSERAEIETLFNAPLIERLI